MDLRIQRPELLHDRSSEESYPARTVVTRKFSSDYADGIVRLFEIGEATVVCYVRFPIPIFWRVIQGCTPGLTVPSSITNSGWIPAACALRP